MDLQISGYFRPLFSVRLRPLFGTSPPSVRYVSAQFSAPYFGTSPPSFRYVSAVCAVRLRRLCGTSPPSVRYKDPHGDAPKRVRERTRNWYERGAATDTREAPQLIREMSRQSGGDVPFFAGKIPRVWTRHTKLFSNPPKCALHVAIVVVGRPFWGPKVADPTTRLDLDPKMGVPQQRLLHGGHLLGDLQKV